jgi:phage recombination protein Bet
MTTALVKHGDAPVWNEEQVALVKRTVAKDATNDELKMFMHLSGKYNLDPFAKEIWFLKMGGTPTITTSRDGYLKIANEHPAFDGLASDVVYAKDSFSKTPEGVNHTYGVGERGAILGAYALIFRKDRKFPIYVFAPMKDYQKPSNIWKTYPHAMILKVAEAMALKRAFSLSGLVTVEELGTPDTKETVDAQFTPVQPEKETQAPTQVHSLREEPEFAAPVMPSAEDYEKVTMLRESLGWDKQRVSKFVADEFKKKTTELDKAEIDALCKKLQVRIDEEQEVA